MGRLTFAEENHEYLWDGKQVPSVTGILRAVGLSKDFGGIADFYKERGQAVHKAIELFLKGTLDETTIDPVLIPYWEGFKRYWEKHKEKPTFIETPQYCEEYGFAGTADLVTNTRIRDWKCSKDHDRVAELQGEGLKLLYGPPFLPFEVIQFPGDGSFKVFEYGDKIDTWPSVMKCFEWWKKTHPRTKINGQA